MKKWLKNRNKPKCLFFLWRK